MNVEGVKTALEIARQQDLSDEEVARRVLDNLVDGYEMRLLAALAAADSQSRLSPFNTPAYQRAKQSLLHKGYVELQDDVEFKLTDRGFHVLQTHLEQVARQRQQ